MSKANLFSNNYIISDDFVHSARPTWYKSRRILMRWEKYLQRLFLCFPCRKNVGQIPDNCVWWSDCVVQSGIEQRHKVFLLSPPPPRFDGLQNYSDVMVRGRSRATCFGSGSSRALPYDVLRQRRRRCVFDLNSRRWYKIANGRGCAHLLLLLLIIKFIS